MPCKKKIKKIKVGALIKMFLSALVDPEAIACPQFADGLNCINENDSFFCFD